MRLNAPASTTWLLISPPAIGFWPILLWHLVILAYLLSLRHKSRQTWLLTGWLAGLTLLMACNFASRVLYTPAGGYIFWIGGIGASLVALALQLQFAYHFPHPIWAREARWVGWLSLLATAGLGLLMLAEALCTPVQVAYNFDQFLYGFFDPHSGQNLLSARLFDVLHPLGHLWTLTVWLRRTLHESPPPPRTHLPASLRRTWQTFRRPRRPAQRAARTFALLTLLGLLAALVEILEARFLLPPGSFATLYPLVVFGILLTYVDHAPEPTTLLVKLVGISLVALLVVWGIVSPLIAGQYRHSYEQVRQSELAHVETLIRTGQPLDATRLPRAVRYVLARPSAPGRYRLLFARPADTIEAIDTIETIKTIDAATLARADVRLQTGLARGDRAAQRTALIQQPGIDAAEAALAGLAPPEKVRGYRGALDGPAQHFIRYDLAPPPGHTRYEIGYSYPAYRRALHARTRPLFYLTLGTALAILTLFPRFFRGSLVRPLRRLMDGVARFNAGDLHIVVPARGEDEIGFLTRAFNAMVRSRRQALAELRESEARYRALFEHAPLCIFEVDMSLDVPTILRANRQAERLYGWPAPALAGATLDRIVPPQAITDVTRMVEALLAGKTINLESVSRHRDGATFPVRIGAAGIVPDLSHIILTIEDITAEKNRRSEEQAIAAERRRIAREIHDGLAQNLASLRLRAEVWHTLLDREPDRLHDEFHHLQALLADNIREVRRSIFALRPVALEELGFFPALRRLIDDVGQQSQLHVELHVAGPRDRLPPPLEPVLFRIVQEALNNVSKHARASTVWINLDLAGETGTVLTIRDDGTGFDPARLEQAVSHGHLGLKQMQERVAGLGGQFRLESRVGAGTTITVKLESQE